MLKSVSLVTTGTAKVNCLDIFLPYILAGDFPRHQVAPPYWDKDPLSEHMSMLGAGSFSTDRLSLGWFNVIQLVLFKIPKAGKLKIINVPHFPHFYS